MKKLLVLIVFFVGFCFIANSVFAGTIKGKVESSRLKSHKDILVYIDNVEGKTFSPKGEPEVMDQIGLVFIPRVIPITSGSAVSFKNSDDVLHSVFGVGDDEFDLGTWKGDEIRDYTFNKLGDVAILCNVHPEMEAYVVVLQNPYHALTDEEGKYQITNVPAGKYKLKTWHDRLRPVVKEIEVPEQGEVTLDFELKR